MTEIEITVKHPTGLHARPAALFVQAAKLFTSKITINHDGKTADAKSIMGIMSLGIKCETMIKVAADGPDEAAAADKLKSIVESNFAE